MNIEFEYMYRDLGNFKSYGTVVFSNQFSLSAPAVNSALLSALGSYQNFRASDLGIPELFFKEFAFDSELDWEMHEFCDVVQTDLPVSDTRARDIKDVLQEVEALRKRTSY